MITSIVLVIISTLFKEEILRLFGASDATITMAMEYFTIVLGGSTFITQMSIVVISLVCNIMLFKYGTLSVYGPDIPISVISIETKEFTIVINIVVGIINYLICEINLKYRQTLLERQKLRSPMSTYPLKSKAVWSIRFWVRL